MWHRRTSKLSNGGNYLWNIADVFKVLSRWRRRSSLLCCVFSPPGDASSSSCSSSSSSSANTIITFDTPTCCWSFRGHVAQRLSAVSIRVFFFSCLTWIVCPIHDFRIVRIQAAGRNHKEQTLRMRTICTVLGNDAQQATFTFFSLICSLQCPDLLKAWAVWACWTVIYSPLQAWFYSYWVVIVAHVLWDL